MRAAAELYVEDAKFVPLRNFIAAELRRHFNVPVHHSTARRCEGNENGGGVRVRWESRLVLKAVVTHILNQDTAAGEVGCRR